MNLRTVNIATLLGLAGGAVFLSLRWAYDTPTAAVQATWTSAGLVGALVTAWNLRDSLAERRGVILSGVNGDRLFLATDFVRVELIRLTQMLGVTGVGLYLLQSEPQLTAAQRKALHIPEWTTAGIIVTAVLLGIVLGTVAQALLDRRQRNRIQAKGTP